MKIIARKLICFSYHELGIYDLPAMIDYILDTTRHEKMYYIGHSEGTTQFWVMASEKPEYNSKIILMIGLAPAAFSGNIRGPIKKLAKLTYFGVVRESLTGSISRSSEFAVTIPLIYYSGSARLLAIRNSVRGLIGENSYRSYSARKRHPRNSFAAISCFWP